MLTRAIRIVLLVFGCGWGCASPAQGTMFPFVGLPEMIARAQGVAIVRIEAIDPPVPDRKAAEYQDPPMPSASWDRLEYYHKLTVTPTQVLRGNLPKTFKITAPITHYERRDARVGASALIFLDSTSPHPPTPPPATNEVRFGLAVIAWDENELDNFRPFYTCYVLARRTAPRDGQIDQARLNALIDAVRAYKAPTTQASSSGPWALNDAAVEPLLRLLGSGDPTARRWVAEEALPGVAVNPYIALALVRSLKDPDPDVADSAARLLATPYYEPARRDLMAYVYRLPPDRGEVWVKTLEMIARARVDAYLQTMPADLRADLAHWLQASYGRDSISLRYRVTTDGQWSALDIEDRKVAKSSIDDSALQERFERFLRQMKTGALERSVLTVQIGLRLERGEFHVSAD